MKYEKLHGRVFRCVGCGAHGRFLWWWNRKNGMNAIFTRFCKKCGRKRGYKFIKEDLKIIDLGLNKKKIKKSPLIFPFLQLPIFTYPKKYRGLE